LINRRYYGQYGGAFLPEILVATFDELVSAFEEAKNDPSFWQEYEKVMSTYSCRPTPITFAENLTKLFGGARIYIKREDLNHTGAHKANNVMGQGLLKPAQASTALPRPPWQPNSGSSAPYTWERWMSGGKGPMCSGWNALALR